MSPQLTATFDDELDREIRSRARNISYAKHEAYFLFVSAAVFLWVERSPGGINTGQVGAVVMCALGAAGFHGITNAEGLHAWAYWPYLIGRGFILLVFFVYSYSHWLTFFPEMSLGSHYAAAAVPEVFTITGLIAHRGHTARRSALLAQRASDAAEAEKQAAEQADAEAEALARAAAAEAEAEQLRAQLEELNSSAAPAVDATGAAGGHASAPTVPATLSPTASPGAVSSAAGLRVVPVPHGRTKTEQISAFLGSRPDLADATASEIVKALGWEPTDANSKAVRRARAKEAS